MSISYHGIVGWGSGKATLPSVETWGSSMNMLRDPPKSLYTRKIDRVGQTSEITQMIQDSGDRFNESIQVYARGSNPMVAVDYSNSGNNGGQRKGGSNTVGMTWSGNSGKQSYLPYRIMNGGAFRPPIRDQRDLLPLSRLPRVWTSQFSQPGFADFSKKAMCPGNVGDDYQGVKSNDQMLRACVRPTATYQLETPIVEPYEVKYVIKNPLQVPVSSGAHTKARFNGEIGEATQQIHNNPLKADVHLNQSGEYSKNPELDHFNTEKYTHDALQGQYESNRSQNIQITSIDDILSMDGSKNIRENFVIDYTAPQKGHNKYDYMHDEMNLERVLPQYNARTNVADTNVYKRNDDQTVERVYSMNRPTPDVVSNLGGNHLQSVDMISSRQYNLRPTVNPGGFSGVPTLPTFNRENSIQDFDTEKTRMRQRVFDMQQDRVVSIGQIPFQPSENSY